jgi:citrate synthase
MTGPGQRIRSDMAWSTPTAIHVRSYNLADDLLGQISFGDMAFLEITGRRPDPDQSAVFNACLVSLVEHGVTPNVLAARLTLFGAPEALQGAVAAGILGAGSTLLGTMEDAARLLQQAIADAPDAAPQALAATIVGARRAAGQQVPGIGHPIHKPVDPRAPRLLAIAREHGCAGAHMALMDAIQRRAEQDYARSLPLNVTGAVAAIGSDLGLPWQVMRGFGVMARAVGLVGHLLEEMKSPMANTVWRWMEHEASAHNRLDEENGGEGERHV